MTDERSRIAIEVAERLADGLVSQDQCRIPFRDAGAVPGCDLIIDSGSAFLHRYPGRTELDFAYTAAASAAQSTAYPPELSSIQVSNVALRIAASESADAVYAQKKFSPAAKAKEKVDQCGLVRDIFGNPFRPVTINPIWLTGTIVALAQTIYDERAFDRLPELADALVAAGCDNQDILNHCRSDGPHVRGCWMVDLVLGKG